jgi:hypothetical protein
MKILRGIKGQFIYLKRLTPSPKRIKENAKLSVRIFTNGLTSIKILTKEAKTSYKNIYANNINLAIVHQKNGDILDAKLRYTIAHLCNKTLPEPLLGLAEIAIQKQNNKKAVKYFKQALILISNKEQQKQIEYIINEISI